MLEIGILALVVANSIVFGVAGHLTNRPVVFLGLLALAAVIILLSKLNVLFPHAFNEYVQRIFGRSAGASEPWVSKNLVGWALITLCSYLFAVAAF